MKNQKLQLASFLIYKNKRNNRGEKAIVQRKNRTRLIFVPKIRLPSIPPISLSINNPNPKETETTKIAKIIIHAVLFKQFSAIKTESKNNIA